MPQKFCYLDWRPCATTAFSIKAEAVDCGEEEFSALSKHADALKFSANLVEKQIEKLWYSYRTDGLFLFLVEFENKVSPKDRDSLVCLIASFIKIQTKHDHFFGRRAITPNLLGKPNPLSKSPVPVVPPAEWEAPQDLAAALEDDLVLTNIIYETDQMQAEPDRAIYRLRNSYAALFDKTIKWCRETKSKRVLGIPLYNRIWMLIGIFMMLMVGISVHQLTLDPGISDKEKLLVWFAGVLASASIIVLIELIIKGLKLAFRYLVKPVLDFFGRFLDGSQLLEIKRSVGSRPTRYTRFDLYFILACASFLIFPFEEVPHAIDLFKLVKVVDDIPLVQSLDQRLAAVSLKEASKDQAFLGIVFENAVVFVPLLVFCLYLIDIKTRRKRVIEAYRDLWGHLQFASILDQTIYNALNRANAILGAGKEVFLPTQFGYGPASEMVRERLRVEMDTRRRNRILMLIVSVSAVLYSWPTYLAMISQLFGLPGSG